MNQSLGKWLGAAFNRVELPGLQAELRNVETRIREALTSATSAEGFAGESYIAFLNCDDLILCWKEAQESAPGFIPFASNGGGELYGLDSRKGTPIFVLMPSLAAEWGAAMILGTTWDGFGETLKIGNLFDRRYPSGQAEIISP